MTPPRSDHFNGKTFFQGHHSANRRLDVWRWKLTSKPKPWPASVAMPPPSLPPTPRGHEIVVTWIGHATFLIQTAVGNFLTDPVFSERASPVRWAGPKRVHPPGIALDELPRIDAVLLSHDHYDHCDVISLGEIATRHNPVFVAPLRNGDILEAAGAGKIVELDWWESCALHPSVSVRLTPSQHWSNRLGTPRNYRLWGGFFLEMQFQPAPAVPRRLWFVGDTGYDGALFRSVQERCGAPDLALVPIGAYEPRWFMAPMHINPAEAVQLHRDVGAKRSIGMHWGTFQLTDEGREDPLEALTAARQSAGLSPMEFQVLNPGVSAII